MSAPVAPLGPLPSDKHLAVLEVYDALRAVAFACRPTTTNPTGMADPDEAKRRLDRLRRALVPFPDRRLYPDPFAALNNGRFRLAFPAPHPASLYLKTPAPVEGATSVHDATVRLAGRVFDGLRVVKLYEHTDPATGERSRWPNYPHGYEYEDEVIVNGVPVREKVTGIVNRPETEHYTAVPWSADLWGRLHEQHGDDLAAYAWSPLFDPHPGLLRAELEREAALVPDPPSLPAPADRPAPSALAAPRPAAPSPTPAPTSLAPPRPTAGPAGEDALNALESLHSSGRWH